MSPTWLRCEDCGQRHYTAAELDPDERVKPCQCGGELIPEATFPAEDDQPTGGDS